MCRYGCCLASCVLIADILASGIANAICYCTCVNGRTQPLCTSSFGSTRGAC